MNILALDLGSKTGFASNIDAGGRFLVNSFICGTWKLATDKELAIARTKRMDRRRDPRVTELFSRLIAAKDACNIQAVVFEDVQFSSYTLQTQLWSSLRAAVWLAFDSAIIECVPVSTLKKYATGNGAATKEEMACALCRHDPRFKIGKDRKGKFVVVCGNEIVDDNGVDAAWIHRWATQNLSRIKI